MTWVYIKSETSPDLFTVGFYKPDGAWEPESDHRDREDAAKRVAWLNGNQETALKPDGRQDQEMIVAVALTKEEAETAKDGLIWLVRLAYADLHGTPRQEAQEKVTRIISRLEKALADEPGA